MLLFSIQMWRPSSRHRFASAARAMQALLGVVLRAPTRSSPRMDRDPARDASSAPAMLSRSTVCAPAQLEVPTDISQ
jgi:hypothetical protein